MQLNIFSGNLFKLRTELLVVPYFEDVRPLGGLAGEIDWLYSGVLSRVLLQRRIVGKMGENLLYVTRGKLHTPLTILVGFGPLSSYGYSQFTKNAKMIHRVLKDLGVHSCAIELDSPAQCKLDPVRLAELFLEGWDAGNRSKVSDLTLITKAYEKAKMLQYQIRDGSLLSEKSIPKSKRKRKGKKDFSGLLN
ncbi:MAG: M17 family peptidase N-terminal domain-containing protein [Nitrospiria bacterium]